MVNVSLVEVILREQEDPGSSTSRKIRELYNTRSGEDAIVQHTDEDKEFQSILLRALEAFTAVDDEETPISYTVKLKDSVENITPAVKRRSIIKLPKENKGQSESDDASSDSEKIPTASSITIDKPFSPLFLNNMKKFGVSTDWLAKRSNSARHSSYSRSSIKSNTSKLDAMIKSASAKPIRSNRKLSFIEDNNNNNIEPIQLEFEKENVDPAEDVPEPQEEPKAAAPEPSPYDLSSEVEEDKENEKEDSSSPASNGFSLRIARVNTKKDNRKRVSSSSSNEDPKPPKTTTKKKRMSKKKAPVSETKTPSPVEKKEEGDQVEPVATAATEPSKRTSTKKEKADPTQVRIDHLKKLLRTSGIRSTIKKTELEELPSDKARIKYLKSLFDTAGYTGSLSLKDCRRFREKRDSEKELMEIRASAVDVKGHVKGGRTLRGQARTTDESDSTTLKRKRVASTEGEDNAASSENDEDDQPMMKKRRILKMEASPEVSETELELL